jgi:hypothetical protein
MFDRKPAMCWAAWLLTSACAWAQGTAQEVVLFDVDFATPPHVVGAPPVLAEGRAPLDGPSEVRGDTLVVESLGPLQDQPCRVAGVPDEYSGCTFRPVGAYERHCLELDVAIDELSGIVFQDNFVILLDTPKAHSIRWRTTGEITVFAPGVTPQSVTIGTWAPGQATHVRVDADLIAGTWSIELDGLLAFAGALGEPEALRTVRVLLSSYLARNTAGFDNLLLTGEGEFGPPFCSGDQGTVTIAPGDTLTLHFEGVDPQGDDLTLFSFFPPLPPGAVLDPPAGTTAPSPFEATLTWTPGPEQLGVWPIFVQFLGTNGAANCTATVEVVSECFLLGGLLPLDHALPSGDWLSVEPLWIAPVTLDSVPVIPIPDDPALLGLHLYFQVYMNNPGFAPRDPIQMSNGIDLTLGGNSASYGNSTGLHLWASAPPVLGGSISLQFSIDGL